MVKRGIILNLSARKASKINLESITSIFNKILPDAKIYIVKKSFDKTVQRAVKDGCKILCAAGGDGTVSGVASWCVKNNLALGVLPLGTMNNFSKDLKVPQDIKKACKVISKNKVKKIDYATINNDLFINNSSIGVYARYVHKREKHQKILGKIAAYITSLFSTLAMFSILDVTLQCDGETKSLKTPVIFISNNDYGIDKTFSIRRKSLNSGLLTVNILIHKGIGGVFKTIIGIFTSHKITKRYKSFHTDEILINIKTKNNKITVAKDGEIISYRTPLQYKMHKNKLKVIAP